MRIVRTSWSYLRFCAAYVIANIQAAMEYRAAFWVEVGSVIFSDLLWVFFWWTYFERFPLANGWQSSDLVVIWAVTACGLGLHGCICGNVRRLSGLIMHGSLDAYLTMPRNILIHVCISYLRPTAFGDVLFGLAAFLVLIRPGPLQIVLFLVLTVEVALIFTAILIIYGSLAFFIGNVEELVSQVYEALIAFSLYPMQIFHGVVKLLLFTVVPAGFISFLPSQIISSFSWSLFAAMSGVTVALVLLASVMFHTGLRRYESGNVLGMQEG